MEDSQDNVCPIHNQMIQLICRKCKSFLCCECMDNHADSACGSESVCSLKYFVEKILLPQKVTILDQLSLKRKQFLVEFEKLKPILTDMKHTLSALEQRLKTLMTSINGMKNAIDFINDEPSFNCKEDLAHQITNMMDLIVKKPTKKGLSQTMDLINGFQGTNEGSSIAEKVKELNKNLLTLFPDEKVKSLTSTISSLSEQLFSYTKDKKFSNSEIQQFPLYHYYRKHIDFMENEFCKYNTQTGKSTYLLPISEYSTILQANTRVFLFGGLEMYANQINEFLDNPPRLHLKTHMSYQKGYLTAISISQNIITIFGGRFQGSSSNTCENYDYIRNTLEPLPSLNNARNAGGAIILKSILYAIGGHCDSVEYLNLAKKDHWEIVNFVNSSINLNSDGLNAFPISENEVIILRGSSSSETGIWNIKAKEIQPFNPLPTTDNFYGNITETKDDFIISSWRGHIYLFSKKLRNFTFKI